MPSSLFQDLLFWSAQACACAALRTELCSWRVFSWCIDLLVRNNSSPTILDLLVRNNLNSSVNNNSSARGEIRRSADNACIDAQVKAPICRVARGSVLMLFVEALSLSATKKPVHKGMLCILRVCKFHSQCTRTHIEAARALTCTEQGGPDGGSPHVNNGTCLHAHLHAHAHSDAASASRAW